MTVLRRGISYQLRQDLVSIEDEPEEMIKWVKLCLKIEGRRKDAQGKGPRSWVPPSTPKAPSSSSSSSSLSTLRISSLSLIDEEALKENDHLIVSCILDDKINIFRSTALLDLDATEFAFIDEDFARCHSLPLYKLKESRNLEVIDD